MAREGVKSSSGGRTAHLRRSIGRRTIDWRSIFRSREFVRGIVTASLFVLACTLLTLWARSTPMMAEGRIMRKTAVVRTPFELIDGAATQSRRDAARQQTPWIYVANDAALESIRSSLDNLPLALASVESIDQVDPALRNMFGLQEDWLEPIQSLVTDGEVDQAYTARVRRLDERLRRWIAIVDLQSSQRLLTFGGVGQVELRSQGVLQARVDRAQVLVAGSGPLREHLTKLIGTGTNEIGQRGLGFESPFVELILSRLVKEDVATYTLDEAETSAAQETAEDAVEAVTVQYVENHVIFARGDELTAPDLDLYQAEMGAHAAGLPVWQRWTSRLGVAGIMTAASLALAGYCAAFCPRIRRNPIRAAALAALMAATLACSCVIAVNQPTMIAIAIAAPPIFVAVISTIAYEQRVGLAFGLIHGAIVTVALDQTPITFVVIGVAVAAAVWQLREIRDRNALIRMGVVVAILTAACAFAAGLADSPLSALAIRQITWDSGLAGFGGLLVGGVVLFILPTIEKTFDITTGMTLIELRDPKQPLLRQLQQRAPGTYNHSLNVASLGEAAADAIGADALLTYVGALYHDIGKMNKPEYFVENQTPGLNKHDKLSPAMSLLIIVGHVKDGTELAREFGLPRPLHHFIEGHHGTTLVEYFFHRAKQKAEEEGGQTGEAIKAPNEIEYRYPGPKPRTKEVAIIMLCDAVESAARAMAEPTPSRIETLVREIANKRLMDGQFDECDLSLRELSQITETVTKTLAAIYHGRIAYPSKKKDDDLKAETAGHTHEARPAEQKSA